MRLTLSTLSLALLAIFSPVRAHAQQWSEFAYISGTLGVSDSRICIGEASRGELGCPSFAPTISPTGRVHMTSGLTVNSVSLTTTGTTWGYLGSNASYIPNLNTNNISLSTINGVSVSALGGGASPTDVPAFRVHKNGTDQSVTAATYTNLTWSTKEFDTKNNFTLADGRFTPTNAGYYYFHVTIGCLNLNSSNLACVSRLRKNGTTLAQQVIRGPDTNRDANANTMAITYMNGTTDYVESQGYSEASTAVITGSSAYTYFEGSLLASGNGLVSGTVATTLSALTDVALSSPASGQILTYNGTSWVNGSRISATTLQIISDTTPQTCDNSRAGTLRYNSPTTALELCTGTGWQVMGVGIPAGTISAFASTTCPTGWSEYTPARGRFLRGIDNGAGNDPDGTRLPDHIQNDELKSHTHTVYTQNTNSSDGSGYAQTGTASTNNYSYATSSSGGAETRPKNVAVTFCQFNGTSNGWNNPLSGGSTVAAGSTGQIQYNTGNSFDANEALTWDNANQRLAATNISTTLVKLANNPSNPCDGAALGSIKTINGKLFVCRQ